MTDFNIHLFPVKLKIDTLDRKQALISDNQLRIGHNFQFQQDQ